jgi:hypothetical protein
MKTTKLILIAFTALFLLSGCKVKEVIRYVPTPPTIVTKIDSITVLRTDSFREYVKGDTLYQLRWKTLYSEKIKIQKDTLSIPFEVRVEVPVEKIVIKYKHDLLWWIGLLCFGIVIGIIGFKIYKVFK